MSASSTSRITRFFCANSKIRRTIERIASDGRLWFILGRARCRAFARVIGLRFTVYGLPLGEPFIVVLVLVVGRSLRVRHSLGDVGLSRAVRVASDLRRNIISQDEEVSAAERQTSCLPGAENNRTNPVVIDVGEVRATGQAKPVRKDSF